MHGRGVHARTREDTLAMNTLAKLLVPISAAALGVGVTFVVSAAPDDASAADAAPGFERETTGHVYAQ